jgi:ABC-type oligopeptide transport system ATPase subunit
VVHEIGFEVARSRTPARVGESGCGKTTSGKAVVQLLRDQAIVSGQALLEGSDLLVNCKAKPCWQRGATCRSSSSTLSHR